MKDFNYYFNELEKHIANYNSIDKSILVSDVVLQTQTCLDCISYYAKACMTYNRHKDKFSESEIGDLIGKITLTSKEYTITQFHKKRKLPEMSEPLQQLISRIRNMKLDHYFKQQTIFDIKEG